LKKVLIVTPNWPPISCPDLHRARMALPYFAEFGWEPLILKINPDEQEGIKDPDLCRTVPEHIKTWQAGCLPLWLTKWTGLRNVGLRSYFHLARLGDRIIQTEKPQVVFFSTTMFPLMTLGRYWQRRHGIPYVLDFQDPWRREKKSEVRSQKSGAPHPGPLPGAERENGTTTDHRTPNLKARLADQVAGILEPFAVRRVSHMVSVSPAYVDMFRGRYFWLGENDFTVLPFGAAEADYEFLHASPMRQAVFNPHDGRQHWVYVGRGGDDMNFAVNSFFTALASTLKMQPELKSKLAVHFIGTSYAPKERAAKTIEPLAAGCGLGDVVSESTDRIPYFEALQCLLDADALFVPGSDDPGYTASKIYPYILARKPLLAVFHEASTVVQILNGTKAGTVASFRSGENVEAVASRILATGWLASRPQDNGQQTTDSETGRQSVVSGQWPGVRPPMAATDWPAFAPYTAREMTRKLCQIFDKTAKS
jgi:hypothetical protein